MFKSRTKGLAKGIWIFVAALFVCSIVLSTTAHAGFFDWIIPNSVDYVCKDSVIDGSLDLRGYDSFTFTNCVVNGHALIQGDSNSWSSFKDSTFNGGLEILCPTMVELFENTKVNGGLKVCEDIPPENDNGWIVEGVDCNTLEHKTKWEELSDAEICINVTNTYNRNRDFVAGIDFEGRNIEDISFGLFSEAAEIPVKQYIYGQVTDYVKRNETFDCHSPYYIVDSNTCGYNHQGIIGEETEITYGYGIDRAERSEWTSLGDGIYELDPFRINKGETKTIYISITKKANTDDYLKFDLYTREDGTVIYTTQDPWLNSDWAWRQAVTITNPDDYDHVNETITVNLTHGGLADTNCSDIRVTDSADFEIDRTTMATLVDWVDNGKGVNTSLTWTSLSDYYFVNITDCTVMFWATSPASSSSTYYIYYNNTGVGEPTLDEYPFELLDTFEQDTVGQNPTRWEPWETNPATEYIEVSNTRAVSGTKSLKIHDDDDTDFTGVYNSFYNSTNYTIVGDVWITSTAATYEGRGLARYTDHTSLAWYGSGVCFQDTTGTWWRAISTGNSTKMGSCREAYSTTSMCEPSLTSNYYSSTTGQIGKYQVYCGYGHSGGTDEFFIDDIEMTNGHWYLNRSTAVMGTPIPYSGDLLIYGNVTTNNTLDFYYGDFFSTNITAVNNSDGTVVGGVWFEFNNTNYTGTNISTISGYNGGVHNWNFTFDDLEPLDPDTSYQIKQYVESVTDVNNYTNTSTFFTINYYWLNNNTATLSVNPAWEVDANNETEVTCTAGTGNATLYRDGVEVTNPENTTLSGGIYNYTCVASSYGYYNQSDEHNLLVRSGFFVNSLDLCGETSYDAYSLYAYNATDSYYNQTVPVGERVDWSLLPYGNTLMNIVNDTTVQLNSTFNITVNSTMYETRDISLYRRYLMDVDVKDETTETNIYFDISVSNSTDSVNASDVANFTGTWDTIPHGDLTIIISNSTDDYITRYYYTTLTQCSDYNETLYMLSATEGHYVRYHIYNAIGNTIQDAEVTAERIIDGDYTVVEEALSDGSGTATIWLDPDVTYRITITASGYETYTTTMRPSEEDYNVFLASGDIEVREYVWDNVQYSWRPDITMITPMNASETGHEYSINFTIASLDSQLDGYGLTITWNETTVWNSAGSNPAGETIYAVFNITGNITEEDLISCSAYFSKAGYGTPNYISRNYRIVNYTASDNSLWSVAGGLDLDPMVAGIIIIILAIIVGIIVSYGTTNPYIGGGAVLFVLTIGAFLGMFDWTVTLLLWLGYIGVLYLKGGV